MSSFEKNPDDDSYVVRYVVVRRRECVVGSEQAREPTSVSRTLTSRSIRTEASVTSVTSGAVGGAPDDDDDDELASSSGVAATFVPVPRRVVFVRNDNEAAGMHVARTHRALGIPRVEKAMHRLAATIGLECTAIDVRLGNGKVRIRPRRSVSPHGVCSASPGASFAVRRSFRAYYEKYQERARSAACTEATRTGSSNGPNPVDPAAEGGDSSKKTLYPSTSSLRHGTCSNRSNRSNRPYTLFRRTHSLAPLVVLPFARRCSSYRTSRSWCRRPS